MSNLKHRAYSMDAWRKDFAAAFAAAVPMEAASTQARGALLASSNDEPEPAEPFSEEWRQGADRAHEQRKDDIARGCDERAMRRETDLYWRGRDVEDFIRGGQ